MKSLTRALVVGAVAIATVFTSASASVADAADGGTHDCSVQKRQVTATIFGGRSVYASAGNVVKSATAPNALSNVRATARSGRTVAAWAISADHTFVTSQSGPGCAP